MAAKRGTKGDYGCKVPKGGSRKGCGAGGKVFELERRLNKHEQGLKKTDRRIAAYKKEVEALKKKAKKK